MSASKKILPAQGSPAPAAALSVTPQALLQMFRERWLIGLLVGAAAAAAFILLQPKKAPVYVSEASLLFETRKDHVLNIPEVVDSDVRNAGELNIHLEQLRSQTFFDYVLNSFTPEETTTIQKAYVDPQHPDAPPPSLAAILRPNVSFYVRRNATIIGIVVSNRSPASAALIANRYARRYIDYNLDSGNTRTNSVIIFLRNQADEMRAQVEAVETSLQTYRAKNNIAALGENQNVILQKVSTVGTELVKSQMEQVDLRSVLDKINEYKRTKRDLLEIPAILEYNQVAQLKARLTDLQAERVMLGQKYLRLHPKMTANALALTETTQLLQESVDMAVANLETRLNIAAQHEQRLHAELEDAQKMAHELDKISVDYRFIEQDATTKRATYNQIVNRLNEASVSSQMENTNIKIFDPAFVPDAPAGKGLLGVIAKGIALGGGLFLFVPVLLGLLDTRIKTVAHIEGVLGKVLLGAVKSIDGLGEAERAHAFRLHKDDAVAESYRGIYSMIDVHSEAAFPKAIITTSTLPGDGKSLTASNLAAVFAAHGRRTLLVDCDLRRPVLHRYFGVDNSRGWLQSLAPAGADGIPEPTPITFAEHLDLLPSGGAAKNPAEALERFVTSGLLKRLVERYDLVLIDTPPVAVFPDALLLCRYCKELIYVCKFGRVRLNAVRKTLEKLDDTGVKVVGLVLNQMPEARFRTCGFQGYGAYSREYYQSYTKTSAAY